MINPIIYFMFIVLFSNALQRVRVWLVALARTKLVKETEPVRKSAGFSEYTQSKQWVIHVVPVAQLC
jgi:hypothetical protein